MQVAEDGLDVKDNLAVEGNADSEHAVSTGVLRPQVDGNRLGANSHIFLWRGASAVLPDSLCGADGLRTLPTALFVSYWGGL